MMSKVAGKMIEVRKYNSKDILIKELGGVWMLTVRGDLSKQRFQTAIAKTCGLRIPQPLKVNSSKNLSLAWMSPDELLIFTYSEVFHEKIKKGLDSSLKGMHSLILDVSGARNLFMVEGILWRELLAKGSPVDLRKSVFTEKAFRRTRLGQVSVAFWMASDNSAYIICGRSYSDFFYDWLCNAASDGSLTKFF